MKVHIALILLPVIAACVFFQSIAASTCFAITVEAGDRAPYLDAETLAGEESKLKEHLGKNVVLMNFWSVFCRDCISRMEALNKINDLFSRRDFELVEIAVGPPTDRMFSQVKKYASRMHYDVNLDPELEVFDSYGVENISSAVLVGRDGPDIMAIQSLAPEPLKAISGDIDRLTKE
jgi:peroxiredoxin